MSSEPRIDLGAELLPSHAQAALASLDRTTVVVASGGHPSQALTAAALLVQVCRTHAHVELDTDVDLPPNPWCASTLGELYDGLQALRPPPREDSAERFVVTTARDGLADRFLASDTWTVACSDEPLPSATWPPFTVGKVSDGGVAPYGGLFGAGLVAAELFGRALSPLGLPMAPLRSTFVWNLVDHRYTPASLGAVQLSARRAWPALCLAACGSVGSSFAAALACDDLSGLDAVCIDADTFDSDKNTFRYPAAMPGLGDLDKSSWCAQLLASSGADARNFVGSVGAWAFEQPEPGFDGFLVSSVDTIDGRYEVADVLARGNLSAAVRGLSLHVQREHLGDGMACPFCDFVSLASPLSQAQSDAVLTGLSEQRIIEMLHRGETIRQSDVNQMVAAGKLTGESGSSLVGRRIADLRARLYAQASVPAQDGQEPPAPLSAPFVSWATGVLLAAEFAKASMGLPLVNRRVELDLHGYPGDFIHRRKPDSSGRCACARVTRRRWMRRLYPNLTV